MIPKYFDKYTRIGRLYPTVLTAVPLLILVNDRLASLLRSTIEPALYLNIIIQSVVSTALIYLLIQINRFIGKEIERIMFKDELKFPTTRMLFSSDRTISSGYRDEIKRKVHSDFNINLSNALETQDPEEYGLQARDAVGLIRARVKDGRLLLQHNTEYGFIRNLIGGSVIAFLTALTSLLIYHREDTQFKVLLVLACLYFLVLIAGNYILKRYSVLYAKRLYQEYITN